MLREIIDTLTADIEALEWVEIYGGLANTFELEFENYDKEGNAVGTNIKRLPVRCGLTYAACMENGKYAELIPDSSKKSLLFWEPKGDIDVEYRGKRMATVSGQARLMAWLNLQELGHADKCTVSAQAAAQIMGIIRGTQNITTGPLTGSSFEFLPTGLPTRQPSLWSGYDFDGKTGFLMYPFDFFSIDVDFMGAFCSEDLRIGRETNCTF